jgi:hypothetical protein
MERDGSGVSALVGLDGLVVRAQLLDDTSGRPPADRPGLLVARRCTGIEPVVPGSEDHPR